MSTQQAADWARLVEVEFDLWASDPCGTDLLGLLTFGQLQRVALLSQVQSGDAFVLPTLADRSLYQPYGLRLHLVEADRVRTPRESGLVAGWHGRSQGKAANGNDIFDGVEVGPDGRVAAYWFHNNHPNEARVDVTEQAVRVIPREPITGLRTVLHLIVTERPEQRRGLPILAGAIKKVKNLERFTDAELAAAVAQTFLAYYVKSEFPPLGGAPLGKEAEDADDEMEIEEGTVQELRPGQDLGALPPTHPGAQFDPFVKAITEQVGASLEIPAEVLLKAYDSNYSSARAARLEATMAFTMWREWICANLCRPVYELWMTEAVALGRINAPGFATDPLRRHAYLQSGWVGPSFGQLDPIKEVKAELLQIGEGLTTHAASAMRLTGARFDELLPTIQAERAALAAIGQQETTEGNSTDG